VASGVPALHLHAQLEWPAIAVAVLAVLVGVPSISS
jgi:hypothetical protein